MHKYRPLAAALSCRGRRVALPGPRLQAFLAGTAAGTQQGREPQLFRRRALFCSAPDNPLDSNEPSRGNADSPGKADEPGKQPDGAGCRDLAFVVDAVGRYLQNVKQLPTQEAVLVAANASGFASHVLSSLKQLDGNANLTSADSSRIDEFLEQQTVNEYVLFFESLGLSLEAATQLSYEPTDLATLLELSSLIQSYGVDRRALGVLFDKNRDLVRASSAELLINVNYLEEIGICRDEFPALFSQFPELLTPNLRYRWKPFMDVLVDHDVSNAAIKRLMKHFCGYLLKLPQVNFMRVVNYFYDELKLEQVDLARILKSHPEVLLMDLEKNVVSKVEFLSKHNLKGADISRVFARCPSIVGHSVDNLNEKVKYLRSLGVRLWCVKSILVAYPSILASSVENKLKPAVAVLKDAGIRGPFLGKLVTCRPAIFAIDVKEKLPAILDKLKDLGPETMVRVLSWGLSEGIGAMEQRVNYLRSLGFEKEELVKMLSTDPRILKISKMGMDIKLRYLTKEMGMPSSTVVEHPTFLYSHLDRRIRIRHEVLLLLHQKGVLATPPQVREILHPSNQEFMEKYVNPYPECVAMVKKHQQMIERDEDRQKAFLMQYAPQEDVKPKKKYQLKKLAVNAK